MLFLGGNYLRTLAEFWRHLQSELSQPFERQKVTKMLNKDIFCFSMERKIMQIFVYHVQRIGWYLNVDRFSIFNPIVTSKGKLYVKVSANWL